MKIVEIREKTVPISSPIRNAYIDFSKMTLSLVAVITDVIRDGKPVIGYGFNSNGRYGQGTLMRERFIPRILEADPATLVNDAGTNLDPHRIWNCMLVVWQKAGSYDGSSKVSTWIFGIAYRQALKALRGHDEPVEAPEEAPGEEWNEPEHVLRAPGRDGGVRRGLQALTHSLSSTVRPFSCCTGRALCLYSCVKRFSWASDNSTGCFSTNQFTSSLQGGVVSEPGKL